jgi:general secretion pathway protein F/type IV pilus assembly protein PilC
MTSTAFGGCDEFVAALTEFRLVGPDGLKAAQEFSRTAARRGPRELADHLVRANVLTRYQADAVLAGNARGLVFTNFAVVDRIGTGSLGDVYKARSAKDDGWYAVKIVPRRNVVNLASIAEKVQAFKQVRHPRVSALVNVGASGEHVYLVWPFLEGGEKLDAFVHRQGRLPPRLAAQIALQVAAGLQPYHEQGLFHGLLKPTDVLIGADRRVRVLDLGVGFLLTCERGKALLDTMTNGKALAKGLDCASPESILDPLARTPAGDQYSLGCILYFCLTGQFPFPENNPVRKMLAHQNEEPTPVEELSPGTPPGLAAIVARLMCKAPEERFADLGEVVQELQALTANPRAMQAPAGRPAGRPVAPSQAGGLKVASTLDVEAEEPSATAPARSRGALLAIFALAVAGRRASSRKSPGRPPTPHPAGRVGVPPTPDRLSSEGLVPEFTYEALSSAGVRSQGSLTATSEREALGMLDARGMFPLRIAAAKAARRGGRRVRSRVLAAFYAQLADLLHSGVPLLRSLDILERQTNQPAFQNVLREVRARVADGMGLAQAMGQHPKAFNELAVSMVRAGQEGGFLEDVLRRIADFTEQQEDLKAKVIGALAYPIFLACAGFLILNILVIFFVPKFEPIFKKLEEKGELPSLTVGLMAVSHFMQGWGGITLLVGAIVAVVAFRRWAGTEGGRKIVDAFKLRIPVAGKIYLSFALSRFTRILGTLLHNGIPILKALTISKDSTGNRVLAEAIDKSAENITAGDALATPLTACKYFPRDVVEMIAVGEESNNLDKVLVDIAQGLEKRTGRQLELFVRLLEPLMLLVMAFVTLLVVAGLLLPVFKMGQTVG